MEVERYKLFLVEFVITVTVLTALYTHICMYHMLYNLEECTISKLYVLKIYYTLYK